jgi:hypothetical protein
MDSPPSYESTTVGLTLSLGNSVRKVRVDAEKAPICPLHTRKSDLSSQANRIGKRGAIELPSDRSLLYPRLGRGWFVNPSFVVRFGACLN